MDHIAEMFKQQRYIEIKDQYFDQRKTLAALPCYFLTISLVMLEEFQSAEICFRQLKAQGESLPDFFLYYALCLLRNGKFKQCKKALARVENKTVLFFETNIEVSIKLAQLRRAKKYVKQAKVMGQLSATVRINEAIISFLAIDYKTAETQLLTLFNEDPSNQMVCDYLVRIYLGWRQHTKRENIIKAYLKHRPGHFPYLWQLMGIYCSQSRFDEIDAMKKQIQSAKIKHAYLRSVFSIPAMCRSESDITQLRQEIEEILDVAIEHNDIPNRPDILFKMTPFYLTYHQQSNRIIFEKLAHVFSKGLMALPKLKSPPKRKRPKVAIICQYLHQHSVMDFYGTLIENFPKMFHVTIIHINPVKIDSETKRAYKRADFLMQSSGAHSEIVPFLIQSKFDMILYPEIGMSPSVYFLAMLRLSPLQVALVGHPETSGMKTIDYYISWEYFNSSTTQNDFTETLIGIKNMPLCYLYPKKIDQIFKTRDELGLPKAPQKVFLIPMLLFKLQPVFDEVIARIVKADPKNHVVMICFNYLEKVVTQRLKKYLSTKELTQVHFKMPYSKDDYYAALKSADMVLETFPFGGGNTVLHCLAAGTPVITFKGTHIKTRFGAAFYEWINERRFIATTIDEYVEKALLYANDTKLKAEFFKKIQANKNRLFDNMTGVNETYDWFKEKLNH
ncbi:MAG: hypothetical protein VW397_06170 [Candidatus Margulisiibacteriota bacterium]